MAKTKTKTHNGYASKHWIIITLLVLTTALMIATVTYAWFLNTLKIPGVQGTTGTFKYEFIGFDQNSNIAFSHGTETDSSLLNEQDFHVNSGALVFDGSQQQGEFYVLVHKLEGSVDLDVSVRFNAQLDKLTDFDTVETEEGEPIDISVDQPMSGTAVQYVGGFWYCVEQVTGNYESLEAAKNAFGSSATEADGDSYFPGIRKQVRQASLDTKDYTCIRVTFGRKGLYQDYENSSSASFNNKKITIYAELNVAQKGGLPDSGTNQAHSIKTEKELKDALLKALPGDELIIESDIMLLGDLIINRPLKLTVASGSLTVQGDVRYTYMGERDFEIDLTGGPLIVQRMPSSDVAGDVGGNFLVELPKSSLTIYGRAAAEEPDLSVENKMVVYTNYIQNEEENDFTDPGVLGMYLSSVRVTDANGAPKRISMAYTTKLTVGQHSSVGTISIVTAFENISMQSIRVFILNHGTIEGIDLSSMVYINGYANPRIYVHNYGVINTLPNQSFNIHLPAWARPYILNGPEEIDKETSGNTLIIREDGSEMTVKTEGNDVNRYNNSDIYDWGRNVLIDKVTNDGSSIIIHYLDGKEAWGEEESKETSIATLVDHYVNINDPDYRINPEHVTTLKIVCYAASEFALTEADYAFIRSAMPNLESIDLSEAYSENYQLPNNAFNGLANLSTIKLSDKDTGWGSTLFTGTQVTTITLPLNLKAIAEDALQGIRVLYARNMANILIQGASGPSSLVKYLAQIGESTFIDASLPKDSTPKIILIFGSETARETMIAAVEQAHNTYYGTSDGFRDKTNSIPNAKELTKISRIFVGNNAQFIGDYLITLNNLNNQCTIHAYLGDSFDAIKEAESLYQFNFKQFTVNGLEFYNVVNYDSFAFFNIKMENVASPLEFSQDLVSIGDAAFYNANLPENVSLGGCQTIGHAALAKNSKLKNLAALELITAGYYSVGGVSIRFANTPKLTYVYGYTFELPTRLDIGLVQFAADAVPKAAAYSTLVISSNSNVWNTAIIVHTDQYDQMPSSLVTLGYQASSLTFAPADYKQLLVDAKYCGTNSLQSFGVFDTTTMGVMTFQGEDVTNDLYNPGAFIYNLNDDGQSYRLMKCISWQGTTIDGYQVDKNGNYVYATERGVLVIPSYTDAQSRTTTHAGGVFSYHSINNVELLTFADSYTTITGGFCGGENYANKKYFISIDLNNIEVISGANAFYRLPSLVTVTGEHVKSISKECFKLCPALRIATFPEVLSIGASAFESCSSLEVVSVPKATFGMNAKTFLNCSALKTASIGPQYAASDIFRGCPALETIYIDLSNLDPAKKKEHLFLQGGEGSYTNTNLKIISLGQELTWEKSKNSPYWNNDSDPANDVDITYSQTTIDASFDQIVFADWVIENKVAAVKRASSDAQTTDIPYTVATPTYMLSKDGNQLTIQMATGLNTITGESYTIPQALAAVKDESGKTFTITTMLGTTVDMYETVDSAEGADMVIVAIEKNVYANKIFVDSVVFPTGLKRIGQNTFAGCRLGAVNIQGASTGLVIENNAFAGATMSSLTIENVTTIGDKAFIEIHNSVNNVKTALTQIHLGNQLISIGEEAFRAAMTSSIITTHDATDEILLDIGSKAFYKVTNNRQNNAVTPIIVNLGGAVVTFGEQSFYNVPLDTVTAPYTFSVMKNAFAETTINEIDFSVGIPASFDNAGTQSILPGAFYNCQIETITLGRNASVAGSRTVIDENGKSSTIYAGAFENCNIGTLNFDENSAISPGAWAFISCSFDYINLNAMTEFSTGLESGTYTFYKCSDLGVVDFTNVMSIGHITNQSTPITIVNLCGADADHAINIGSYSFQHLNIYGKINIASESTLGEYAFYKATIQDDFVMQDNITLSSYSFSTTNVMKSWTVGENAICSRNALSSTVFNGKVTIGDGAFISAYFGQKAKFNGDVEFGAFTTDTATNHFSSCSFGTADSFIRVDFNGSTLGSQMFQDNSFYANVYLNDGVNIAGSTPFLRAEIYGTCYIGSLGTVDLKNQGLFGYDSNNSGNRDNYVKYVVFSDSIVYKELFAYAKFDVIEFTADTVEIKEEAFKYARVGKIIGMDKVISIGNSAFSRLSTSMKTVISDGLDLSNVQSIGNSAFLGYTFNKAPDISSIATIGSNAFQEATIPGELIIPTTYVTISGNLFLGATIDTLTFEGNPRVQANAFKNSIITTITFEKGGVIEAEAFAEGTYGTINLGSVSSIGGSYNAEDGTYTGAFRNATIGTINFEESCVVTETYTKPIADRAFAEASIEFLNFAGTTRELVGDAELGATIKTSEVLLVVAGIRSPFYGANITRLNLNGVTSIGHGIFANLTIGSVDTITSAEVNLLAWSLSGTTIQNGNLEFDGAVTLNPLATAECLTILNGDLIFNHSLTSTATNPYPSKDKPDTNANNNQIYVNGNVIINNLKGSGNCFAPAYDGTKESTNVYVRRSTITGDLIIKNTPTMTASLSYVTMGGLILENVYDISNNNAFGSLTIQKRVNISSLKTMSGRAFGSTSFPANTYLHLPNLTKIGTYTFASAKNIVYVHAPILKVIGYATFSGVSSLKSIQLDSLEEISSSGNENVFKNCSSLETIIIGDKLKTWGANALGNANNSNLKVILLVEDISQIAESSTIGLSANATLMVPRNALASYEAYFGTDETKTLWGSVTKNQVQTIQFLLEEQKMVGDSYITITYVAELLYGNKIEIVDIYLMPEVAVMDGSFTFPSTLHTIASEGTTETPYTVVSIAGKAMSRLPGSVKSITLPETLEFVNFSGLDIPDGLQQFVIAESNEVYKTVDGILYTKNGEMLVLYPNGMDASAFELPEGVTYIGAYAFAGNQVITSLSFNRNLVISDGAFNGCTNLTSVSLTGNFIFIGRNTITGSNPGIGVTVTGSCLVLYDVELREKMTVTLAP